jgi:hypothetical protein
MHIFSSTRLKRKSDAFDRKFEAVVIPSLTEFGFAEVEPYCFRRIQTSGCEIIYFNITPRFFVGCASFCPNYMLEIDELYDEAHFEGEPHIGCYHIITPKGVFRTSQTNCSYKCKLAMDRDRSLSTIVAAIHEHAIPWISGLHDPTNYASSIDSDGKMYFGRAHEVIGKVDNALEAYEEQFRRCLYGRNLFRTVEKFARAEGGRTFVYLSLKLQRELDLSAEVQNIIGYHPSIKAFPEILFCS